MNITLTPTKPVKIKTSKGPKVYKPGETFKAKLEEAQPFIKSGILRKVEESTLHLTTGSTIEWDSPVFGLLTGKIQMIPGDGTVVVDHPVTGELASIPIEWVKQNHL